MANVTPEQHEAAMNLQAPQNAKPTLHSEQKNAMLDWAKQFGFTKLTQETAVLLNPERDMNLGVPTWGRISKTKYTEIVNGEEYGAVSFVDCEDGIEKSILLTQAIDKLGEYPLGQGFALIYNGKVNVGNTNRTFKKFQLFKLD
jgi:hypothetical protein